MFPFIRFTNWKQEDEKERARQAEIVSIHTLHELEARIPSRIAALETKPHVSIHTLHELEARLTLHRLSAMAKVPRCFGFHSYASRIGSKTSFAKLGCTRIVQRFFVGY
jgi:hypothetical protein